MGLDHRYLEATRDSLLDFGLHFPSCWNSALENGAELGLGVQNLDGNRLREERRKGKQGMSGIGLENNLVSRKKDFNKL